MYFIELRKGFVMSSKVTIIGAGSVGSTIAYTMAIDGIASEIVMIDVNTKKALGEAMDIRQGTPFCSPISIYAGSYSDAENSDVVVITSGIARKPGQSRLELTQTNVDIIKSIAPEVVKYAPNAVYIIVSNPVDILTYVFNKVSGIPESRIIGSGTILDTARLRSRLSEYLSISQKNVHAYVMGEHGDSSFIPWSLATVSGVPLQEYHERLSSEYTIAPELDYEDIEKYMRTSGGKIISRKGATYYAIAVSVCHIVKCIFSSVDSVLTVSTMMHGEFGISDVCLSMLSVVGRRGIMSNITPDLTEEEIGRLRHSADVLKDVISQVNI